MRRSTPRRRSQAPTSRARTPTDPTGAGWPYQSVVEKSGSILPPQFRADDRHVWGSSRACGPRASSMFWPMGRTRAAATQLLISMAASDDRAGAAASLRLTRNSHFDARAIAVLSPHPAEFRRRWQAAHSRCTLVCRFSLDWNDPIPSTECGYGQPSAAPLGHEPRRLGPTDCDRWLKRHPSRQRIFAIPTDSSEHPVRLVQGLPRLGLSPSLDAGRRLSWVGRHGGTPPPPEPGG